jgi:hypothetical protein
VKQLRNQKRRIMSKLFRFLWEVTKGILQVVEWIIVIGIASICVLAVISVALSFLGLIAWWLMSLFNVDPVVISNSDLLGFGMAISSIGLFVFIAVDIIIIEPIKWCIKTWKSC